MAEKIRRHELKTWPQYFEAVRSGAKKFDIRKADRDFRVGDYLDLSEWDPISEKHTGRVIVARIQYILAGPGFGLKEGFVCMSIEPETPYGSMLCFYPNKMKRKNLLYYNFPNFSRI